MQLQKGIPKDSRDVNAYMTERDKDFPLYTQFLEDFKARFGSWEEAQPTIQSLENALKLYNDVVGKYDHFFSFRSDLTSSCRTC